MHVAMSLSKQELVEMHPLLRRLSGQAIWCMFEEYGAAPEDITAFLDLYELQKERALETLGRAFGDAGAGFYAMLVRVEDDSRACAFCRRMRNRVLLLDDPDLAAFFPPYGLGCPAEAVLLTRHEFRALENPVFIDTAARPPSSLLCSDWIFTHPWRDHKK